MSVTVDEFKKYLNLELEILQENEMNAEKANEFYDRVISFQANFAEINLNYWSRFSYHFIEADFASEMEYVEKKIVRMKKHLSRFLEPVNKSTPSSELKINDGRSNGTDQPAASVNLKSLLQKQKFYILMLDSFVREGEISPKKAELQYEHVSQLYEKFVSNQSEITTFVEDDAFDDQVKISKEIQDKVLSLQETLKDIFSPTKPTLSESKVNEHFNRTDRPSVIVDFLESQYMKQKSLIEQIELIQSKQDPTVAEAEVLYNHVSQLYDTFIKNQAKIETYVKGPALDKELEMSREILVKVMSLQTKLKEIIASVESPCLVVSKRVEESKLREELDKVTYLNLLLEKQQCMIKKIDGIASALLYIKKRGRPLIPYYEEYEPYINSLPQIFPKLKTSFDANQTKIEELLDDDFDLHKQKEISTKIQNKLDNIQDSFAPRSGP